MSASAAERKATRHAARDWREIDPSLREKYERIARRWAAQDDLSLWEWADEYGVRRDFLLRAAIAIGVCGAFGNHREAQP